MRIERRLPFGFKGDWGKCYKRYTGETELLIEGTDYIRHEKTVYRDIGQDVQFREATDETGNVELPNDGLLIDTGLITVKTTDSYFNNERRGWFCVVAPDDLVIVFGRKWIVQSVNDRIVKRAPNPLKVFFIELKGII